jgi:hypothetical protein
MSITKNQLKQIVKECLIEILSEGIGQSTTSIVESNSKKPLQRQQSKVHNMSTVLQQTASKTKLNIPHATMGNNSLSNSNAIKEAIKREAGNNNIMADILADTAANTLPTMLENDRTRQPLPPVGSVERVVASTTPDQLFGEEATSKWAALAFMDPIKK